MSAIAHQSINPLTLPSVPLDERSQLPSTACVYFCLSESDEVLYIGKTTNLRQRWMAHHRYAELEEIGNIHLAWLQCSANDLEILEDKLIKILEPLLNGKRTKVYSSLPLPEGLSFHSWFFLRRRQLNFSQDDIATALGVSGQTVSNWERSRSIPTLTIDQIKTLCKILNCTLDEIPGGIDANK